MRPCDEQEDETGVAFEDGRGTRWRAELVTSAVGLVVRFTSADQCLLLDVITDPYLEKATEGDLREMLDEAWSHAGE